MHAARARPRLGGAKDDAFVDTKLEAHIGKRGTGNQRHLKARQLALIKIGIGFKQGKRHNRTQNRVAQKLQALVGCRDGLAFYSRRMRNGRTKQIAIGKRMIADRLRPIHFFSDRIHALIPPERT